jgi:hypothetical protein
VERELKNRHETMSGWHGKRFRWVQKVVGWGLRESKKLVKNFKLKIIVSGSKIYGFHRLHGVTPSLTLLMVSPFFDPPHGVPLL